MCYVMVSPKFDFDHGVVTLTFKILFRLYLRSVRCRKLTLGRIIDCKGRSAVS